MGRGPCAAAMLLDAGLRGWAVEKLLGHAGVAAGLCVNWAFGPNELQRTVVSFNIFSEAYLMNFYSSLFNLNQRNNCLENG
jgi:hypothetical protein